MGRYLDIAEMVLQQAKHPMSVDAIVDTAQSLRHLDGLNGLTPIQTMKARLSEDIKEKIESRFVRTGPGMFGLREWGHNPYVGRRHEKKISEDELVLVVPLKLIQEIGIFQGINLDHKKFSMKLLDANNFRFISRIAAESDNSFKQILSYVIIKYKNNILRFQRGNYTNVDSFLKGRFSIGFGGHVKRSDRNIISWDDGGYSFSVMRELNEELKLPYRVDYGKMPPIIGVLNDDSSTVGKTHIAFIHLLELEEKNVIKREKSINQLQFVPMSKLHKEFEMHEFWSKLCIKKYFHENLQLTASYNKFKRMRVRKDEPYLAIVGSVGSGKTEFSNKMTKYGYQNLSTSEVVRKTQNIPSITKIGRHKFQEKVSKKIDSGEGATKLAHDIFKEMSKKPGKYVIDGLRYLKTFHELKKLLGGKLPLLYVETTPDDALKFYRERENKKATPEEFFEILSNPVEKEIPLFAKEANFVFYNYGNYKSFIQMINDWHDETFK